ncbi:MAG: beta-galactosidase [Bacteroidaceae bacterium]|nr:beta-galactosidase [Bacteroidaceae bacterium]
MKKIMSRFVLLVTIILLTLLAGCKENVKIETLVARNGVFYRNDTLFKIASAELSYPRVPREYWASRMQLLKRMGINTLSVRVPWMLHETKEGCFDFEGNRDVREFCRMAQEHGFLVWLHVGPAVDEFMDMGGLPWWLLKDKNIGFTAKNKLFMEKVGTYFRALGEQLSDMQLSKGGPIALIQISEPNGLLSSDKKTLLQLQDSVVAAGFSSSIFTVATDAKHVKDVIIPRAIVAIGIDAQKHAMSNFTSLKKIQNTMPVLCYDVNRSCTDIWGADEPLREWHKIYMRMYEVFSSVGSINISSICGGSSFGHIAGATKDDNEYLPYSTTYFGDAIIDEHGLLDDQYFTFGKALNYFVSDDNFVKEGLHSTSLLSFPETEVCDFAPLLQDISSFATSVHPMTMEQCNIGYGAIMYETTLPLLNEGDRLFVKGVHDNAQLFVDGKPIASVARGNSGCYIPFSSEYSNGKLQILVDAMGRVGDIPGYKDYKGLTDVVQMHCANGRVDTLTNWKNYPLPAEYDAIKEKKFENSRGTNLPGYYKTIINCDSEGDTYLNLSSWTRGEAWINGHSLGRFWNKGPVRTLYVPGCWLQAGDNELIIVDWVGPSEPKVSGIKRR